MEFTEYIPPVEKLKGGDKEPYFLFDLDWYRERSLLFLAMTCNRCWNRDINNEIIIRGYEGDYLCTRCIENEEKKQQEINKIKKTKRKLEKEMKDNNWETLKYDIRKLEKQLVEKYFDVPQETQFPIYYETKNKLPYKKLNNKLLYNKKYQTAQQRKQKNKKYRRR